MTTVPKWSKILTASAAALYGAVGAMAGDPVPVPTATGVEADAILASEPARAVSKIWAEADYLLWFERAKGDHSWWEQPPIR